MPITLTIEQIQDKYGPEVRQFCLELLHDDSQAFILYLSTFEALKGRFFYFKDQEENDIKVFLFLTARNKCIKYSKYLRFLEKTKS
jgi:DNA-directed RNA polymerase specialized sigma24 family protein